MKLPRLLTQYIGLLVVLLILVGLFSGLSHNFFQLSTVRTIASQIPDLTFIAVGMTLVLIVGGIDLSVGSLLALCSAVLGQLMVARGWSLAPAVAMSLVCGGLCGLANGIISVGCRIPSFIVTLGMLEVARGLTKVTTNSQSIFIGNRIATFSEPIAYLGLSPAFLLSVATVVGGQFLLSRTVFGRYAIAIGTNEETVRMSGIRTGPYSVAVFVLSGVMCALAGFAQTSRLVTVDPNAAVGVELSAIAACVIGGTSLKGGQGNVVCSFLGVLIISVLQTGLAQLGVPDPIKQVITGSVIIAAVLLDAMRRRHRL